MIRPRRIVRSRLDAARSRIADRGEPRRARRRGARERVRASRAVVDRRARGDEPAYGINTGLRIVRRSQDRARRARGAAAQPAAQPRRRRSAIRCRSRAVRATMALRANVLAKGFSGISVETLEALIALLNARRPSARAVARLGRRQRRPRAARAPRARADRRRRGARRRRRRRETARRETTSLCGSRCSRVVIPAPRRCARRADAGHARRRRKGWR